MRINLDAVLANADWPKRTPDYPLKGWNVSPRAKEDAPLPNDEEGAHWYALAMDAGLPEIAHVGHVFLARLPAWMAQQVTKNVEKIVYDPTIGNAHYVNRTITFGKLLGKEDGYLVWDRVYDGWYHQSPETATVHEIGHALWHGLDRRMQNVWEKLSQLHTGDDLEKQRVTVVHVTLPSGLTLPADWDWSKIGLAYEGYERDRGIVTYSVTNGRIVKKGVPGFVRGQGLWYSHDPHPAREYGLTNAHEEWACAFELFFTSPDRLRQRNAGMYDWLDHWTAGRSAGSRFAMEGGAGSGPEEGHEFRGNQHTGGIGGAGYTLGNKMTAKGIKDWMAHTGMTSAQLKVYMDHETWSAKDGDNATILANLALESEDTFSVITLNGKDGRMEAFVAYNVIKQEDGSQTLHVGDLATAPWNMKGEAGRTPGMGAAVLREAVRVAQEKGLGMYLYALNSKAAAFYEHVGMTRVGPYRRFEWDVAGGKAFAEAYDAAH